MRSYNKSTAFFMVIALFIVICLSGCAHKKAEQEARVVDKPSEARIELPAKGSADSVLDTGLVSGNTKFAVNLLHQIAKQDSGKNIFISPLSISICLAMVYNGASGETREEMANALQLQDLSLEVINNSFASLLKLLSSLDENVKLLIANSLWAKKGIEFSSEFIDINKNYYAAEVSVLDFGDPSAPSIINNWVKNKTNGLIPNIIDRIASDDLMFLINAIYFKGIWTHQFDEKATRDAPFYRSNGVPTEVKMMSQNGKFPYFKGENFGAISLPYGNKNLSMYIFLPDKDVLIESFVADISAEKWESWMSSFAVSNGSISLPRFEMSYEILLNDVLKSLGMLKAFGKADFDAMFANNMEACISVVKHKAFVEVNEEGTEAAAVTMVGIKLTSVHVGEFRMLVNRPFLCAIRDNTSGTILFMGIINRPKG